MKNLSTWIGAAFLITLAGCVGGGEDIEDIPWDADAESEAESEPEVEPEPEAWACWYKRWESSTCGGSYEEHEGCSDETSIGDCPDRSGDGTFCYYCCVSSGMMYSRAVSGTCATTSADDASAIDVL